MHVGSAIADVYHDTGEAEIDDRRLGAGRKSKSVKIKDFEKELDISDGKIRLKSEPTKPAEETKTVAEATTTAEKKPVIKVGEVVESKGEKVKKDIPPRVRGKDVEKMVEGKTPSVKDEIIDAAISSSSKTKKDGEDEGEKDIDEKVQEKIKDEITGDLDPKSKIEGIIDKKKEEAKDKLIDELFKEDDEAFARETAEREGKKVASDATKKADDITPTLDPATKATPSPSSVTPTGAAAAADPATRATGTSRKIIDASGKTPADTPAAKAALAADRATSSGSLFDMTPGAATKTLLADAKSMSMSVVKGLKGSKNLRLAATAALLSATGYGFGKLTSRDKKPGAQLAGPDESEMIRRQMLEDG